MSLDGCYSDRGRIVGEFYNSINIELSVINGARCLINPQNKQFYKAYGENHYILASVLLMLGFTCSSDWLKDKEIITRTIINHGSKKKIKRIKEIKEFVKVYRFYTITDLGNLFINYYDKTTQSYKSNFASFKYIYNTYTEKILKLGKELNLSDYDNFIIKSIKNKKNNKVRMCKYIR